METQLALWMLAGCGLYWLGKGVLLLIVLCIADTPKKRVRAWN